MKTALVIGHDHVAGIEHVGEELERRGFALSWFSVVPEARFEHPDVAVTYPGALEWDLVVTLGAPWPRHAISAWTPAEVEFLAHRHEHGRPTLGICFGGQLLAEALGSGTTPLARTRVGWHAVDPLVGEVDPGPWFHWNADQLVAPDGAEVLATGDEGVEAFRVGRSVALQFHPEMTPRLLRRWLTLPGMPPPGLDLGALEAATALHVDRSAPASRSLLDLVRWHPRFPRRTPGPRARRSAVPQRSVAVPVPHDRATNHEPGSTPHESPSARRGGTRRVGPNRRHAGRSGRTGRFTDPCGTPR